MYDLDRLANDLASYVESGAIDEENAIRIYNSAVTKNNSILEESEESEESEDDFIHDEMTLESALDILAMEEEESSDDSEEISAEEVAKAKKARKEMAKKIAKALAITTVASAAVVGGSIGLLAADDKNRAKKLAGLKSSVSALNDKALTDEYTLLGNESPKEQKKKYKKILALQKLIDMTNNKIENLSSPSLLKKLQDSAAGKKLYTSKLGKHIADKKTTKMLNKGIKALNDGKIDNIELDDIANKASEISKKHGIKIANENASNLDLINEFIEERIQEACDECNPVTHTPLGITERLPKVTPNESDMEEDDPEMAKTDRDIEDAKKDLDIAGKLAEMRAAHEAEKDTTQQHETIKQALESVEDYINNTKLNIYESADAGIITEEEKYELLNFLDNACD